MRQSGLASAHAAPTPDRKSGQHSTTSCPQWAWTNLEALIIHLHWPFLWVGKCPPTLPIFPIVIFTVDGSGPELVRSRHKRPLRADRKRRHERTNSPGDQRILPRARARGVDLRPPRRQRRQAGKSSAQRRTHHDRHARSHPRLHGAQFRRRTRAAPRAVRANPARQSAHREIDGRAAGRLGNCQ